MAGAMVKAYLYIYAAMFRPMKNLRPFPGLNCFRFVTRAGQTAYHGGKEKLNAVCVACSFKLGTVEKTSFATKPDKKKSKIFYHAYFHSLFVFPYLNVLCLSLLVASAITVTWCDLNGQRSFVRAGRMRRRLRASKKMRCCLLTSLLWSNPPSICNPRYPGLHPGDGQRRGRFFHSLFSLEVGGSTSPCSPVAPLGGLILPILH